MPNHVRDGLSASYEEIAGEEVVSMVTIITQCECKLPDDGKAIICPRHNCKKPIRWVELCQTSPNYFQAWEEGHGAGQPGAGQPGVKQAVVERPPLRTQVASFLTALARFAGDGCKIVDKTEFDRRLEICADCDLFIRRNGRCGRCGCFGAIKARGRVWTCPEGKWDRL